MLLEGSLVVDSKLRSCDLVAIRVRVVFTPGRVKELTSMTQRKMGKSVRVFAKEYRP